MKIIGLYFVVAVVVGIAVARDAVEKQNTHGVSAALGVFFGLTWPMTLLLWIFEKQDGD